MSLERTDSLGKQELRDRSDCEGRRGRKETREMKERRVNQVYQGKPEREVKGGCQGCPAGLERRETWETLENMAETAVLDRRG